METKQIKIEVPNGYENGKEYILIVSSMFIRRLDNSGRCKYESLTAFFKNWDNIQILELGNEKSGESKKTN